MINSFGLVLKFADKERERERERWKKKVLLKCFLARRIKINELAGLTVVVYMCVQCIKQVVHCAVFKESSIYGIVLACYTSVSSAAFFPPAFSEHLNG